MMEDLSRLGRKWEDEGKITTEVGDSYARAALDYLLKENKLASSTS